MFHDSHFIHFIIAIQNVQVQNSHTKECQKMDRYWHRLYWSIKLKSSNGLNIFEGLNQYEDNLSFQTSDLGYSTLALIDFLNFYVWVAEQFKTWPNKILKHL